MSDAGVPDGDVYDWYQRGLQLLANRDPAAAATILARAAAAEPGSRSLLEALARAQYDAGRYAEAVGTFRELTRARWPGSRRRYVRARKGRTSSPVAASG